MQLDRYNPPWVAVDVEGSGSHPDDGATISSVGLAWPGTTIALPFDQGTHKLDHEQLDLLTGGENPNYGRDVWIGLLLWLRKQRIVMHNGKYDLEMFATGTREWGGTLELGFDLIDNLWWDTMVAEHILEPKQLIGLDDIGRRIGYGGKTGRDELKAWLQKHKHASSRYDLVPWPILKNYLEGDMGLTVAVVQDQQRRLAEMGDDAPYDRLEREFALTRTLTRMEMRGVGYDDEMSQAAADELLRRADELEKRVPYKADVNGAKAYYFGKLGLQPLKRTDVKGDPKLDEEQIRVWIKDGVEYAEELYDITRARRAVSMYYNGWVEKLGKDGRLRTEYKQTKVKSGRMSVGRIQLQAMPKGDKYSRRGSQERLAIFQDIPDVRSLLRAREGCGVWNIDLSQAELRVASRYSHCNKMLDMLLGGHDAHGHTTETVLRTPRDDPHFKFRRDIGKRLNFAAIFMVGGQTFKEQLEELADIYLPLEECHQMVYAWRREYPEFEQKYRQSERFVKRKGYVPILPNSPYAMRSYFKLPQFGPFTGKPDYERTAWNRIVQGSLAEAFKMWMVEIEKRWPGYMILTIHDSVLLEAPLDEGQQVASEVAAYGGELMTELFDVPMKCDIDVYVGPKEAAAA